MNEIQIFNHEEFGEIQTIEIDGQIYFIGVDVAKALHYSDPIGAVRKRVDEEDRMVLSKKFCREFLSSQNSHLENIPNRGLTIINESGLYSLILASKLPGAKKFKHWVTAEVLPEIRRTGRYSTKEESPEQKILDNILISAERVLSISDREAKELCAAAFQRKEGLPILPRLSWFKIKEINTCVALQKKITYVSVEITFKFINEVYLLIRRHDKKGDLQTESLIHLTRFLKSTD
ncbi:MAG: hypothetical protein K2H29_10125 [Oscillospiraceae bacterium]|nr:hypothetical protein [Oscillospiraceae bacterium]